MSRVLVTSADASGDLHAAEFVAALRQSRPDTRFFGVGGGEMERAGVELVVHQREVAVGGLVEVLGSVARVVRAWRRVAERVRRERPQLAVLVDSPDFNLPLARRLRRVGVPILYYVSPQVWAWRRYRVRKLARRADRMAVIFPFEPAFYAGSGLPVAYVGHPLVERMGRFRAKHDRAGARAALGVDPEAPVVVLLPGSRRNELARGLPLALATARHLAQRLPEVRFLLALAPTADATAVRAQLARGTDAPPVQVVEGRTYEAVLAADVALAKPGTITVEVALLGCPMVVAGRAHPVSAALARRLVRLPSWTMPNLIAGSPVIPEFLQERAAPERVAAALLELLDGPTRDRQVAHLARVAERLGRGGAARRTAAIAEEMLDAAVAAP